MSGFTNSDGSLREPTVLEREVAREWIENGGNMCAAIRTVRPELSENSINNTAWRTSNNPVVRKLIQDALEAAGLTPEHLAKTIRRAVDAKRVVFPVGCDEGVVTEHDDHKTQLAATDMALKLMDAYPDKMEIATSNGSQHLHLHFNEEIKVKRFILLNGRYPSDVERKALEGGE